VGTLGNSGVDICRLGIEEHHHVFSSQRHDLRSCLPGRPEADLEGPSPDRLPSNFLKAHPVDYLLVDMLDVSIWERLLEDPIESELPQAIIVMGEPEALTTESGLVDKLLRKRMALKGFSEQHFWYLCAEDYGGAINQERLVATWARKGSTITRPEEFTLPGRNMRNLLMPTGIPNSAWVRKPTTHKDDTRQWLPCEVRSVIRGEPVFEIDGLMPDRVKALLRTDKGIRRLQAGELAKGKGVPGEWVVQGGNSRPMPNNALKTTTCLHLWSTILDSVISTQDPAERAESCKQPASPVRAEACNQPRQEPSKDLPTYGPNPMDSSTSDQKYIWEWHVPDLAEGGDWYNARVHSLRLAVAPLEDSARLFREGLKALDIHRGNYTDEGIKYLQLLWWEFPPEHWEDLRLGSSMNFLITPEGELELNSLTEEIDIEVAGKFVDELMSLGVLLLATEDLKANCPLFCVDKAGQPGQKRCIADCKRGGQNRCTGQDPCFLIRSNDVLPQLYPGGYTAIADASKFFHNFPTREDERKYLGCIHPVSGIFLVYAGLPMGGGNSPAIACRLSNSAIRMLRETSPAFAGEVRENTWRRSLQGHEYHPEWGHGRVRIGADGEPACLVWGMVDDFKVHGSSKEKCGAGFSAFMDLTVRLGFICKKEKTCPPGQHQKFCGLMYDTHTIPKILLPESKISRARATVEYVIRQNGRGKLSRLSVAVMGGLLQSLVDATPSRQGQTYLRRLYDEIHAVQGLMGKALYYTEILLSMSVLEDLEWWLTFLAENPGNESRCGKAGKLAVTFGDGSGTGTGGTIEWLKDLGLVLEAWMGTWSLEVVHFDSNWKELRTILKTIERMAIGADAAELRGATLFYFTDNMVSYYVVQNGSSSSPELHRLVRSIKTLEVQLGCRIEVIHVPGVAMIDQGTDGLSRGLWMSARRFPVSSLMTAEHLLSAVPYSDGLARWAFSLVGLHGYSRYYHHDNCGNWAFEEIFGQVSIWTPGPEIARQALRAFMDIWVEGACQTSGLFLIPRILQRDWGYLSKYIQEVAVVYPSTLPESLQYLSHVPLVVLYIPHFVRTLSPQRMESLAHQPHLARWHQVQADHVRGLQG
jgi:hypothetical protein